MSDGAALTCQGVTKRFGRFVALRAVDLSVALGECVTLFGHNGAGKSTLLGIACGLIRSYEGTVSVFGDDLRTADDAVRGRLGFVSHETFLYEDLSAVDNLTFWGELHGVTDATARAAELLERFRLTRWSDTRVRALSRGMKQRVALARAIVHHPRLLLLDEPYTGLDEAACEQLSALIRGFVGDGGAALVTTHDIDRGLAVADRVAILDRGRLAWQGSGAGMDNAAFRERYRRVLRPEGREGTAPEATA